MFFFYLVGVYVSDCGLLNGFDKPRQQACDSHCVLCHNDAQPLNFVRTPHGKRVCVCVCVCVFVHFIVQFSKCVCVCVCSLYCTVVFVTMPAGIEMVRLLV